MKRLVLFACALLLASACTSSKLPDNDQHSLGKVGIVAIMGNKLSLVHTGFSSFSSTARTVNVTDWDLNQVVSDSLSQLLQQRQYEVVKTTYTQEDLQSIYEAGPGTLDWKPGNITHQLRKIADKSGADTLILVLRRASPDYIYVPQNEDEYYYESLIGFGLYNRGTFISYVTTATFANLELMVIDAHTLQVSYKNSAQHYTTVEQRFWHADYEKKQPQLVTGNDADLKKLIESEIAITLKQAVVDMNF
jgi:ribosomal 30S subunit maturation factor RimM